MLRSDFEDLIGRSAFLARTPDPSSFVMDVLSEVLSLVKLQGALFFNGEFSAPWCFNAPPANVIASYLSPQAEHLIIYHFVTEGRAYVQLPDGGREELNGGDIVMFPHGDAHRLGHGLVPEPVDARQLFAQGSGQELKLVRFGGGGEITRFVCGFMACESRLCEIFLPGLPKVLKLNVANESSGQWLENTIRFSVREGREAGAGSGAVLAKLSEVLLVETLRRYINALPPEQTGWLAGARDPAMSRVLTLLHKQPAHPWTVSELAKRVGLSRTRLAERFRYFLEQSPIAYLTYWRLTLAAEMLQSTNDSVAEVAATVGYCSEAAFNRAFRRQFKRPPAQFRRDYRMKPPQENLRMGNRRLNESRRSA